MMHIKKGVWFGASVLLLALSAACADQPLTPPAAVDGTHTASFTESEAIAVYIGGPNTIIEPGTYMWQTYATGGDGTYAYVWERRPQGGSTWTYVGSGSIYYGSVQSQGAFELRVTAYSGGLAGSQTYSAAASFLSASISGPTSVSAGTTGTWYANASGGFGPHTYRWYTRQAGTSTWNYEGQGSTFTRTPYSAFYILLEVVSGFAGTTATQFVQVPGGSTGGWCMTCPVIN
jgi:uncharacterized protein YaiE (UPF0345 family)